MTRDMTYQAPVPIVLPRPGVVRRTRRLTRVASLGVRHLGGKVLRRVLRRPVPGTDVAAGLRRCCETLGGTYVKVGQLIGSAPGVFGDDWAREFRGFLDQGPAVPFRDVQRTIERELGRPLHESFAVFDEQPVAAASLAVVHRATLPDGRVVAVKILRPGIEELVATDMDALEPFLRWLTRRGIEAGFQLLQTTKGLREQLAEEIDLRNEARTMDHFRGVFAAAGLDLIVIPDVHHDLTSQRVLTMTFLDGVPVDDPDRLGPDHGVDPAPVIDQAFRAWFLTALRDGIFHADIHAGNLFLLRDGRLGLLDWGIVGRLDPDTHLMLRRLAEAALGDESGWDDIADHVLRLAPGAEAGTDLFGFTKDEITTLVRAQIEPILTRPFGEVGLSSLMMDQNTVREVVGREPMPPTKAARRERRKQMREWGRAMLEKDLLEQDWYRANFLLGKQLLYLERYGVKYLADVPLIADPEYIRGVLAEQSLG